MFRSPLILLNMTIDFLILTFIFMYRIYYGDKFNGSFDEQLDSVQNLLEVLTCLQNMRGYFFDD